MNPIIVTIIALICFIIGCVGGFAFFRYILIGKYNETIDKAEKEAEVIKEKKLLEVKEKFLNKKSELETEVQQRTQKNPTKRKSLKTA